METKVHIFRQVRILLLAATAAMFTGCSGLYDHEGAKVVQAAEDKALAEMRKNPEEYRENTVNFLASQCVLVLHDQPIDREAFLQAGYLEYTSKGRSLYMHFITFQPWISGIIKDRKGCWVRVPRFFNKNYVHYLVENVLLQNGVVRLQNEKGQAWPRYKVNNQTVEYRIVYFHDRVVFFMEVVD
jgi:hypothetical protein